jgi:hypothetical protein
LHWDAEEWDFRS